MFQRVLSVRSGRKLQAAEKPPADIAAKAGDNDAPVEADSPDALITSDNPEHPANLIPSLCTKFWTLGWVTGTGGGCSIRDE